MVLNGLLFISNIYVLGDREAALQMHSDLAASASGLLVNTKVMVCFIAGILYLVAAGGIVWRKFGLALAGVIGFVIFDGFYLVELLLWGATHPPVWLGVGLFGSLGLLIGVFCWLNWQKRTSLVGREA
jgi:hypothetical protein